MTLTSEISLNDEIQTAASLLGAQPALAEARVREVLRRAPDDPRAMLILASARRRAGDHQAAHRLLAPLARAYPSAAHTQYELGMALAGLGHGAQAVAALRAAVGVNPDLAEAWRALGEQLFLLGDGGGAEAAFAEHAYAVLDHPRLKAAAKATAVGRLAEAEYGLRQHLAAAPNDAEAMRMLAEVFARSDRLAAAERLLANCLKAHPAFEGARFDYARVLVRRQRIKAATAEIDTLLAARPEDPAYLNLQAVCLGLAGDDARSVAVYEQLLAGFPRQARIWLDYGHALKTVGRREEAIAAYRRGLTLDPGLAEAYWSLANLKVGALSAADEAAIVEQLASVRPGQSDRLHLHYALGKALEDRGEDLASFAHYQAGAAARRALHPYDAEETSRDARRAKALFSVDFFGERAGGGSPSAEPIFIVGLPRAGSTLVEQILASHPQVEGTAELPHIGFIAAKLGAGGGRYPAILADLDPATRLACGKAYLEAARVYRRLGRARFIDKTPNNFQHIGLIQLILPDAKIIDVRRHPMAACWSMFKQHFAQGQDFSYDLVDVGRYYRDYVELMAHFDAVLPRRVHRTIYEDLIEDVEGEVRALLDYLGLPFDPACLRFFDNDRPVRTASSEQVRRPIFRDGLDQWCRQEARLAPLEAALGPALRTWRRASPRGVRAKAEGRGV
jgi:predicted Zn-dependent protease